MAYQDFIGDPLVAGAIAIGASGFIVALVWIALSLRRVTPELLQLMAFQGLSNLKRATMSLCLSIIIQTILLTIFFANLVLPLVILGVVAAISAALFWYAVYLFAEAFRLLRAGRRVGHEG